MIFAHVKYDTVCFEKWCSTVQQIVRQFVSTPLGDQSDGLSLLRPMLLKISYKMSAFELIHTHPGNPEREILSLKCHIFLAQFFFYSKISGPKE